MTRTLQGNCLLASPFMDDPNFFRSAVLIVQHTDEHSLGLILNRPTHFTLEKVVSMICEAKCVHSGVLYCGGPVDSPLLALHDQDQIDGPACFDGLKICTEQKELIKLFRNKSARLKLFDGVSAWGPGQLEEELETGSWIVTDIDSDEALSVESELWESLIRRVGLDVLSVDEKIADSPANPEWN
jgi:putative transcriptional regulator